MQRLNCQACNASSDGSSVGHIAMSSRLTYAIRVSQDCFCFVQVVETNKEAPKPGYVFVKYLGPKERYKSTNSRTAVPFKSDEGRLVPVMYILSGTCLCYFSLREGTSCLMVNRP